MSQRKKGPTLTTWTRYRIAALRDRIGDTQEGFAKRFRLTVDSVRVWEQGKGGPSGPATLILDQLAAEYGFENPEVEPSALNSKSRRPRLVPA